MTSPVRAPRPTPRRAPAAAPSGVRRRDHLRVVPPPARSARGTRPVVVLVAMVVVFGSLMAAATFHALLVSGQSHLDQVEADLETEREALARDRLVLADLQSPARIAEEAVALGMVPAERQTWLSPGSEADPVVTGEADATPEADDSVSDPTDPDGGTTTGSELAGAPAGTPAQ